MYSKVFPLRKFRDVVGHCELIFPKTKSELQANRSIYFREAQWWNVLALMDATHIRICSTKVKEKTSIYAKDIIFEIAHLCPHCTVISHVSISTSLAIEFQ